MARLTFITLIVLVGHILLVEGQTTEAKLKSVPAVTYPAKAITTGLEGTVTVIVDVDESGKVTRAHDAMGPDMVCPEVKREDVVAMRTLALKTAESARFDPAVKDGKPTPSQVSLKFKFANPAPKKELPFDVILGSSDETANAPTKVNTTLSDPVIGGTALSLPKPAYPPAALAVKAVGSVDVQVIIDLDGAVFQAEAINGHPLLRAAARAAACSSKFAPTLLGGKPVKVSGIITFNFVP